LATGASGVPGWCPSFEEVPLFDDVPLFGDVPFRTPIDRPQGNAFHAVGARASYCESVCNKMKARVRLEGSPGMASPIERNTRQKAAIREAFERSGRPLSTEEVRLEAERSSRGLGMATVYRSIKALLDAGWLSVVEVPGRLPLYEIAGKGHHHHFSCTQCDRVYELEGCTKVHAKLPRGFKASGHEVTLYGTCAPCSAKTKTRGAAALRNGPLR
jgi:Fur family ferric uptake transcriptional regulator